MNQQTADSMDAAEVLHHQRQKQTGKKQSIYAYHKRGLVTHGAAAAGAPTTYRKGACTNCGAITHTVKTCIERPRKIGAKYTGKNIGRDEVLEQVELGWEAKRDQWNGYDPAQYRQVIDEYEMREKVRSEQRQRKLEEKTRRK